MEKTKLIELVLKIQEYNGTEEEIDEMINILKRNVLMPGVTDLIYFDDKTPEEIVEIALSYQPISL
ncbi:MAG: hypothetical protein IKT25_02430 [Firmicutes bacterium]|nr:hypothetical protein [Bacillota bacterium]